ncbi:hypothetical protein E4656_12810 [Natronospirillum operosum]|uniref:Agglutinin biogenesis protein MshI n=1 Tax=Natronospirillum operosum TaxID=2759953 RepID=A0A4Z0WDZ5_9GAMM|nr:hypothetical protein [Natronospirillum operosum]TGG92353.1 hypothetical protein E4656_12810 [Natronospirillum operosum]
MRRLFRSNPGIVGCEARSDHWLLAHVVPGRRPRVEQLRQIPQPALSAGHLRQLAVDLRLHNVPWVWVLPHDHYQLMLVDVPEVPEEEIHSALRWRVKDIISFPLEEAAVDTLLLPTEAFRGRSRMAFAVVTRRDQTEPVQTAFGRAGLRLRSIDVADTALRTLSQHSSQHPATAILKVDHEQSFLDANYQGELCLNRSLSVTLDDLLQDNAEPMTDQDLQLEAPDTLRRDTLALELQRSFDYFETQLGLGTLQELRLVADKPLPDDLFDFLSDRFRLQAGPLALSDHLDFGPQTELENHDQYALAIGGALQWLGSGGRQ